MSIKKPASDLCHILGIILMSGSGVGLFIMTSIATIPIDIAILSFTSKPRNPLLTGYILESLLFSKPILSIEPLCCSSFAITAFGILLSLALDVPGIGALLLAGWAAAALTFSIGAALYTAGDRLAAQPEPKTSTRLSMA